MVLVSALLDWGKMAFGAPQRKCSVWWRCLINNINKEIKVGIINAGHKADEVPSSQLDSSLHFNKAIPSEEGRKAPEPFNK